MTEVSLRLCSDFGYVLWTAFWCIRIARKLDADARRYGRLPGDRMLGFITLLLIFASLVLLDWST